uniref:Uncharacterized protein n=1 Tax=Rhizophora mucronata TaxID=61149 RepID=A0A2P2PCR3_RHIMU
MHSDREINVSWGVLWGLPLYFYHRICLSFKKKAA